jgi:hypothetical protein
MGVFRGRSARHLSLIYESPFHSPNVYGCIAISHMFYMPMPEKSVFAMGTSLPKLRLEGQKDTALVYADPDGTGSQHY